jgi:transmembrane sensor
LTRGDVLSLDLATGQVRRDSAPPETIAASMAAWREKRLVVENWTVAQVLNEIGRYHRGAIMLRDPALGARRVSGFYDLTRPVEAARAVAGVHGGRLTEVGPWLVLVSGA